MSKEARKLWQQKLDFHLAEQAKSSDPEQKFGLQKKIQEARVKLEELRSLPDRTFASAVLVSLAKLPQTGGAFLGRE